MKTKTIDILMTDFITRFKEANKDLLAPSPYLIPHKAIISTDDFLNKTNIQIFYFNREPERILPFANGTISYGSLTGKVQEIVFDGADLNAVQSFVLKNHEISHKEILKILFDCYLNKTQ